MLEVFDVVLIMALCGLAEGAGPTSRGMELGTQNITSLSVGRNFQLASPQHERGLNVTIC